MNCKIRVELSELILKNIIEQNKVESELENLKIEHFKQLQILIDDKQQLQQRIDKLQKALDVSYTLANRYYKNGYMNEIEKILNEMEDEK